MIARVDLFQSKKDLLYTFTLLGVFAIFSLFLEYKNFQNFTKFDNHEMDLYVLNQYVKTKEGKTYEVLKMQTMSGVSFYSISKLPLADLRGSKVRARVWTKKVTFADYFKGFYARTQLLGVYDEKLERYALSDRLKTAHQDAEVGELFGALFFATPISKELRNKLSVSGTSHLLAISGFHLGVLSFILLFILKIPYTFLQNRYAVTRHRSFDLMILIALILYSYMALLGFTPSLLRSFIMMVVGFILYDRGIKVISMQTLLISALLLLALFPRLFYSVAFYLSMSGVFYLFLFLKTFEKLSAINTFIGIHFWVYLMMLPLSLYIFQIFSFVHPLSIFFTMGFILFYLPVLLLHLTPFSSALDIWIAKLLTIDITAHSVEINSWVFYGFILISLASVFSKRWMYLLLAYALSIFIYTVYQIT